MRCVRTLLSLAVVLAVSRSAAVTRCMIDDPDGSRQATARASAEATCAGLGAGCNAGNHGAYVRCMGQAAKDLSDAGSLPPSCKGAVKKCAAKSTCGKPGAVTCCVPGSKGTKCSIKKNAAACTKKQGTVGSCHSCCDACASPAAGPSCAGSTTTTPTTSTTTTTTCGGSCPNSCDGKCVNLLDDSLNCGSCGHVCQDDDVCAASREFCMTSPNPDTCQGSCGQCLDGQCANLIRDCSDNSNCCGNGTCAPTGTCQCTGDWIGADCCTFVGAPPAPDNTDCFNGGQYCSGHGICNHATHQCDCNFDWTGVACDQRNVCPSSCGDGRCCSSAEDCPVYEPICVTICVSCAAFGDADAECVSSGFGDACAGNHCSCTTSASCTNSRVDTCTAGQCVCGSAGAACLIGQRCTGGTCVPS